jgi:5-methylcytosine-specific restriction endonuclease McrA
MRKIPSAEEQIIFLKKIQTLFDDSSFSATYKYALLITLTNLAIEMGNDDGKELKIDSRLIAKRFSEIYWPQIREYSAGARGTKSGILRQNKGGQAEIITTLLQIQEKTGQDDFVTITEQKIWGQKLRKIIRTVWENPVFYLQDQKDQFIYQYSPDRELLTLKPNAVFSLRQFSDYIIQYAKQGWIDHIKQNRLNQEIIGPKDDLESFLFGSNRSTLSKITSILLEYQNRKCFYCNKSVTKNSDVDHFIPWKKYPRDLAENFVLSCPACNRSKSDMLAAPSYRDQWMTMAVNNKERSEEIAKNGFISDKECCIRVASWAYTNSKLAKSILWHKQSG